MGHVGLDYEGSAFRRLLNSRVPADDESRRGRDRNFNSWLGLDIDGEIGPISAGLEAGIA